jgi:hypothetical protein
MEKDKQARARGGGEERSSRLGRWARSQEGGKTVFFFFSKFSKLFSKIF